MSKHFDVNTSPWSKLEKGMIYGAFGRPTATRGADYYTGGHVQSVKLHADDRVTGVVVGTAPRPYEVEVIAHLYHGILQFESECTCPVQFDCKHGAAILFRLLDAQQTGAPTVVVDQRIRNWLDALASRHGDASKQALIPNSRRSLYYILSQRDGRAGVQCVTASRNKKGAFSTVKSYNIWAPQHSVPKYMRPEDIDLLRRLRIAGDNFAYMSSLEVVLHPDFHASELLLDLLATGRMAYEELVDDRFINPGKPCAATFQWQQGNDGQQRLVLVRSSATSVPDSDAGQIFDLVLPSAPPFYIDLNARTCGPIDTPYPPSLAAMLVAAPALRVDDVETVRAAMSELKVKQPSLLPAIVKSERKKDVPPVPVLTLGMRERLLPWDDFLKRPSEYGFHYQEIELPSMHVEFQYSATRVEALSDHDPGELVGGKTIIYQRNHKAEQQYLDGLADHCIVRLGDLLRYGDAGEDFRWILTGADFSTENRSHAGIIASTSECMQFVTHHVPELESQGWRIEYDPSWRWRPPTVVDEWYVDLDDDSSDWFKLSLGVAIEGQPYDLEPFISAYFETVPADLLPLLNTDQQQLVELLERQPFHVTLNDGRLVTLPVKPLANMLRTLLALFGDRETWLDANETLPKGAAAALLEVRDAGADDLIVWRGGRNIMALGKRLRGVGEGGNPRLPKWFAADLRDYQKTGVNWMQALAKCGYGGVLADDMGLGKTVQAIGRLSQADIRNNPQPTLVVAPTSVVPNWQRELARFAPKLKTLLWHGKDRQAKRADIDCVDVVISTYALLRRDKRIFEGRHFACLIIDEAQAAKNPKSSTAKVLSGIQADQRFALTGTPLENNLNELWSMFHLVAPGLLGSLPSFQRHFRTPIETHGDDDRRKLLAGRIKPFLLRRTKEEVASELPEKIVVTESVPLGDDQAVLYESIRLSCNTRIRKTLRERGLARSRITVLDALLKLRQVCCDPSLVKIKQAKDVAASAKREHLIGLLQTLVLEGRRILVFSQFVQMLELVEQDLDALSIPYLKLTGRTRKRQEMVDRFQSGDTPVFLISLKAGGTGLNLTAADTVILYDPWWNPATEAQAMDRTHRIGQTSNVFVYRLIAQDTVEARIDELQRKKQNLARSVLDDAGSGTFELTENDLERLFQPIG